MIYTLRPTDGSSDNFITQMIKTFTAAKQDLAERNALHTKMVEQAGHDKNLYFNTPSTNHLELRFPEYAIPYVCDGALSQWHQTDMASVAI
jgi:hypothetical protein